MKRLFSILLIVVCLFGLCSCSSSSDVDDSTVGKIVYGEKYISSDSVSRPEEEQNYYIVHEDYIEFHYYHTDSDNRVTHYTKEYKYTVIDEGSLVCFR